MLLEVTAVIFLWLMIGLLSGSSVALVMLIRYDAEELKYIEFGSTRALISYALFGVFTFIFSALLLIYIGMKNETV